MSSQAYLKLLSSPKKLWANVNPNGRQIINAVIKKGSGAPYRVQDVIQMREIASQATLHKTLSALAREGYISLMPDPADGRVKFVVLGKKGCALEARLNKLLTKACQ